MKRHVSTQRKPARIIGLVLMLSMVFASVAFADSTWDTSKHKTIVFSTIMNYYTTGLKSIIAEYNKLHPETTVQLETIGTNEAYQQNFVTKMTADRALAPDIVHSNLIAGSRSDAELIKDGLLLDLTGLLNEPNGYNGNVLVKDAIDAHFLAWSATSSGYAKLPFDLVGVGFFYNKTIFDKAGLKAPTTYEELWDACKKLQKKGYKTPITAQREGSWLMSSLTDWAYRKYVRDVISLPGDARYNEAAMPQNKDAKYGPNDVSFDDTVIFDDEKMFVMEKNLDRKSALSRKIWETYKTSAQFMQKNFINGDNKQAYAAFMAQKSPILLTGSWVVGTILGDMKKLPAKSQFAWATFQFPAWGKADPDFVGKQRALLVPGHVMGIANKNDPDMAARAADFLKYMYSPKGAQVVFTDTINAGEYVQGPSLIKGVQLSAEVTNYLAGFNVAGNMRQDYVSLEVLFKQSDDVKYYDIFNKYVANQLTWDQFYAQKEELYKAALADRLSQFNYDGDPKTADK